MSDDIKMYSQTNNGKHKTSKQGRICKFSCPFCRKIQGSPNTHTSMIMFQWFVTVGPPKLQE